MNLRTLRTFVEVVRQGGFSQAAGVVFATQSAVSKAVKSLEEELGVPLLERLGHRSQMTPAGEVVYRRALVLLAERDSMMAELNELHDLQRGVLRVGFPPVGSKTLFAPLFATYRSRYPGIEIRLEERGSQTLTDMLRAGDVDLAALLAPVDADFESQDVRIEPLVVLMPAGHPLAKKKSIDLTSIADLPFILFEEGFALNPVILNACQRRGFKPTIAARSGQIEFIVELAAAGVGLAFLPRMIANQFEHPALRHVLLDEPNTAWHMVLAWRRGAFLPLASRAWLELAREVHSR